MSQWRGHFENAGEIEGSASIIERWYHVPVLVLLLAFTLWNRVRSWENFISDGQVYFSGNDPWYHYRMTAYTVRNWPETMPFDPWTYFPYGIHSSQFGTIFDQLMATAALVVGFGNPDQMTIAMVVLFAPAIAGTLLVVPAFLIGRRLGGRIGGLLAAAILVFSTGGALTRGLVGVSDHQIVEVLFQSIGVLAVMVAVSVGEREKPVYELFRNREYDVLRQPLGWSLLAGFGVATYVWAWPPAVFLIGILGFYFTIELASEHAHGESPEHVAIVGIVTMLSTAVFSLASFEAIGPSPTGFTILQPGLAVAGAVWFGFIAWLSREWERRDLDPRLYPAGIVGLLVGVAAFTAIALPDVFGYFLNQTTRVIGLSGSEQAGTIGEAQPIPGMSTLYQNYGLTVFVALFGAGYVGLRHFTSKKPRAELTLVAVWLAFLSAAVFTMARFDVYLVVPIGALTAFVISKLARLASLPDLETVDDVETYQVLTVLAVVLLLFVPVMYPSGGVLQQSPQGGSSVTPPAVLQGTSNWGPGTAVQAWDESLEWMQTNTPEEGTYGTGDEAGTLDYYGTYQMQEDFEYGPGTYGVLSWWDYGHWIEVEGERIPTANPFQKGVTSAANFLVAPNETQANDVMEGLSDGDNAETRYVMLDWKLANVYTGVARAKFFAPATLNSYGTSRTDYSARVFSVSQDGTLQRSRAGGAIYYKRHKPAYYRTMTARLYRYHGSAVRPSPVVVDWQRREVTDPNTGRTLGTVPGTPAGSATVKVFDNVSAARSYVQQDGSAQLGGIGPYPSESISALEHYRLVQTSETSASASRRFQLSQQYARAGSQFRGRLHQTRPSWVKVFERVPGATVKGEGPPDSEVVASVEMRVPNSNSTFRYTQFATTNADGEFTMTLPYSTTGYDEWGTEAGYTEPSVKATGPYTFRTRPTTNETLTTVYYNATAHVSEGQVIGENDSAVSVDLQREVLAAPEGATDGSTNQTAPSGNETSGALAPPAEP